MIATIDDTLLNSLLNKAALSPRKRTMHVLHSPEDRLQRMVNAGCEDTYIRPHKHENPDKWEVWAILRGRVGAVIFDDAGEVTEAIPLERGHTEVIDIPPRTWHALVVLSSQAAILEIIDGVYDPATHKVFASWAPEENTPEARIYLDDIRAQF